MLAGYSFRPRRWPLALAAVACGAGIVLGSWQARRAEEKRALGAEVDQALKAAPIEISATLVEDKNLLLKRVAARGEFVAERTLFLDNKIRRGRVGYEVITPLKLARSSLHVLVNRGWIEAPRSRDVLPEVRTPAGETRVEGLALERLPHALQLKEDLQGRVRQNVDLGAFAHAKAWKEMGHRYLAAALGLLILFVFFMSLRKRQSRSLATALVLLVVFQATLGMWTVTMLLKPAIVTAHLLGGMAMLALLVWLALQQFDFAGDPRTRAVRFAAFAGLVAVVVQIALGGWVSANYAALACPDLPGCMGQALPPMDFANAFHVLRELGHTGEGELLPREALTAIHWTHRVFALVLVAVAGWAALKASRIAALRPLAALTGILLLVQFSLGVANVALGLPLALAAAHNAGAAFLLVSLVVLNFFSFRGLRPFR